MCKVPSHILSTPLSFLTSRNLSSEMSRSVVGTVCAWKSPREVIENVDALAVPSLAPGLGPRNAYF